MQVRDIMAQPVVTVRRDATLEQAARLMLDGRFSCLPVVDDRGRLCGIVSEADFMPKERGVPFSTLDLPQVFGQWVPLEGIERLYEAARRVPVGEIMSAEVVTLTESDPVEEAVRRMTLHEVRQLPVVRD